MQSFPLNHRRLNWIHDCEIQGCVFLFPFFWINFVSLSFGYATVFIKCNCGFWGYLGMLIWWVWKKNQVVASSLVSVWLEYKLILVNVYGIIEHSLKTWYKFYIMLCVQSSLNESLTLDELARFYLVISMWVRWIYVNNASVSAFFRFDSMNWFCMMSFFFLSESVQNLNRMPTPVQHGGHVRFCKVICMYFQVLMMNLIL